MSDENRRSKKLRIFTLSVTTEVKQLVKADPTRRRLYVYNTGSAIVYILSAQNKTSADGIPVAVTTGTYENKTTTAPMWIIAASGTCDVRVEEDTD